MPESFEASKDVISRYEQEDLYNVAQSLQKAVIDSDVDSIRENNLELSTILDNVWNDERIAKRIRGIKYGIPISTALIGSAAAGAIGGAEGFIAGLAIDMASHLISRNAGSLEESIAKL